MTALLRRFTGDESGATAIEYGLIAALMGVALIAAFMTFGGSLANLFNYVSTRTNSATGA